MAYQKTLIEHLVDADKTAGANAARLVTTTSGDSLAQNVPLLYDSNGNVISTATRSGNTTNYATATAGSKTTGNYPKWDANGNLTNGDTASGGAVNRIRDGLASEYDPTPTSTNTEDDEFNSSSLGGAWTVSTNTAGSSDIDTTWQSHIYLKFTGSQLYHIYESYAPAGDFSLTLCGRIVPIGTTPYMRISAATSTSLTDARCTDVIVDLVRQINFTGGSGSVVGSATYHSRRGEKHYLHLQRVGSTWESWVCNDGLSFYRVASGSRSLTISHIHIEMGTTGSTTPQYGGIDWVRRDWITL